MLISLNKFFKSKFTDKYEKAIKQKYKFIMKFCENINIVYLKEMCNDKSNNIYIYSINDNLTDNYKNEIIGIVVIRKILNTSTKIRIYVPLISIHTSMQSYGYGSIIMDEIISKYYKNKTLEIVLLSLKSSYDFYSKLGFFNFNVKFIKKNETIGDCIMMIKIINKI
jgi:ribosomal protein S18 acetylase RimI-like enzyme